MTSQINPNNIDGTYPVAGQPNNTQGMRDNFTATKTNFQYASDEINDLQSKVVLKSALSGSTLDNNMNDNLLYAVKLQDVSWTYVQNTATSGSITLDFSAGAYQSVTSTGSVSLSFSNWPASGSAGSLLFTFNCTNVAHTLTLPAAVSLGIIGVQGISPGTPGVSNTITFTATGSYTFRFDTVTGGTVITLFDFTQPNSTFSGPVTIAASTVSTSPTTGALIVEGGVGILGNLNVAGNVSTFTSGNGNVYFSADSAGLLSVYSPNIPSGSPGALNIVGSNNGAYRPVVGGGGMIHITGNPDTSARITVDGWTTSATDPQPPTAIGAGLITLRAARGTPDAPLVTKSGDHLGSIAALGFTSGNAYSQGRCGIEFYAAQDFTANTACGTYANIQVTPIGSNAAITSMQFTGNGVIATGFMSATGNIISGGNILATDGGAVGYTTGAGGTISQTGNKSTGVTLNKLTGEITMQNTALAASTAVSFTLTNSTIGARDLLLINLVGGATAGAYIYGANCTTGSAIITVRNVSLGSLSEALVLRYAVIRGSIA